MELGLEIGLEAFEIEINAGVGEELEEGCIQVDKSTRVEGSHE